MSQADKTKPERLLNSKERTQFRGGVGSLGWFVDHWCPQLSFQLAELRRKQSSPTVQDLWKLNKVIRTANVIESKIKNRSIPVEHLGFMGVHDAAHPCTCFGAELAEQEDQEDCPHGRGGK